ncbi:carbohydrate ABC transporter permease [Kamptonema cortianum]|nr:carbohydrate ABC transporter permease [Geitlerinema splendidum]MDK3155319.1 carbohydrate ABC transporter permease [Kamptonema cortianum]
MNAEVIYLAKTILVWIGWILLLRSGYQIVRLMLAGKSEPRAALVRSMLINAGASAFLFLFCGQFLKEEDVKGQALPLVWVYTSIGGWMMLIGAIVALWSFIQSRLAVGKDESRAKLRTCLFSAVTAMIGFFWMDTAGQQVWILRGHITVSNQQAIGVLLLSFVTMSVMVITESAMRQRGLAKKAATHATLIAGSVLFGLPFFWLLSTSFKEERDLMNANGIVWIPKTQETHPYRDPENPLFRTHYEGRTVRVKIDRQIAENRLLVEVERPYGMRGRRFETSPKALTEIPRYQQVWLVQQEREPLSGFTLKELGEGRKLIEVIDPVHRKGERMEVSPEQLEPLRNTGLRWENYTEALEWMPFETYFGLRYLINSLWLVIASVVGTVVSCSLVAYGFSRLRFPGRNALFALMLATMMLPAAVTMLPQFLIFRNLGWVDTLLPLWVPTFFGSAFYIFLLRQFFGSIPLELEEAARIDGCGYFKTYWQVMMPQVKPALAVIAIWTFMSAWNNFMGPLIYISTPEKMPLAYALHLFSGDRGSEPHLMMAFATLTVIPVVILFFSAQKYFIESVTLTGMGGK